MRVIDDFRGEYRFLSNFYPTLLRIPQQHMLFYRSRLFAAPSAEHAYQALKAWKVQDFNAVLKATSASEAKRVGRRIELRGNWEEIKLQVMQDIVREKFRNISLADKLLETAPALLVEGNSWGDRYWGVCSGGGYNYLGLFLMITRNEIAEAR